MSRITVFTKPACVQCNATKMKLNKHGLEYDLIDVSTEENADKLDLIKGWGYLTAPVVLVESDGEDIHWGGYNPDKIEALAA